jgi:hypothetical protein
MGSLATFKTNYLASTVVPTGDREQLAGLVQAIDRMVADGATVTVARQQVPIKRSSPIIHRAQQRSSPYQGTLAADFLALDAA